jgi:hypothetical protein
VFFEVGIALTAKGSSTGSLQVGGLPFNKSGSTPGLMPCAVLSSNLNFGGQLTPSVAGGTTRINIYQTNAGGALTHLSDTALSDTTSLYITGHYEA